MDPAAKTLDEEELTNNEQVSLEKLYSKIGEKIEVPFDARKRIFEICKKWGIPDTEILSLETISEVCPIEESNKSKIKAVVYIFFLLLVYTLAIFFLNKSTRRFGVNAQSYQVTQIGLEIEVKAQNEIDSIPGIKRFEDESPILGDTFKQVLPSEKVTIQTSPAIGNWSRLINASRREEQSRETKRGSIAASAKKKTFDPQNPTIIVTEEDKKKFHGIFIKETFLSKDEFTLEGSCEPAFGLEQLQNTARTVARNSNLTFFRPEFDHFLDSRTRQGAGVYYTRDYDPNIVEAIQKPLHSLLTKAGPEMFRLQLGGVTVSEFIEQILTNRTQVFLSQDATDIIKTRLDGRFNSQDYIRNSQRSAEWNMRFLTRIATDRGLRTDCFKSIMYPRQIYEDAMHHINGIHTRISQNVHSRNTLKTQRELQDLLIAGQAFVSDHLSRLVDLYNSQQYARNNSEGAIQRNFINRLTNQYNCLADLSNEVYRSSVRHLRVPPIGRIISIDSAIFEADQMNFTDQWRARSATEIQANQDFTRDFSQRVLLTNGLQPERELVGIETAEYYL